MAYSPASAIPLNTFGAPTGNIAMASHKFTGLLDGSVANDSAAWDQLAATGLALPYVVSGCVWTADSPGSTLACSMTAGTIIISGLLYSVSAVTSRSFTANDDTYVDVAISGGAATITYTTVANYGTSPALAGGGTAFNTIRLAVISAGASAVATAGINQGVLQGSTNAAAQPSTTVAAGSNGNTIATTPLSVASSSSFISTGGWAQVAHSGGQVYTIQYTGTGAGTLTGVTVVSGTAANTVSTGDTVKGTWPVGVADMIGNRIYPTTAWPGLIGGAIYSNAYTTTLTASSPLPGTNSTYGFIAPFLIPTGPNRNLKISTFTPAFGSSATAGTVVQLVTYVGNKVGLVTAATPSVKVASDFDTVQTIGYSTVAAGVLNAQVWTQSGAAGTITAGGLAISTLVLVELC